MSNQMGQERLPFRVGGKILVGVPRDPKRGLGSKSGAHWMVTDLRGGMVRAVSPTGKYWAWFDTATGEPKETNWDFRTAIKMHFAVD